MRTLHTIILLTLALASTAQTRLDYFLMQAGRHRLDGNITQAVMLYNHCLEIDPNCPEATYQLGITHIGIRQDSLGLDKIRRATQLDPTNPYYLGSLAALLLHQGNDREALTVLERISTLQTKRTDILSHLAELYTKLDQTDQAIKTLDRIELIEGKTQSLSDAKYELYIQQGDSISAFRELEALCAEYPADMTYLIQMAYRYQQRGDNQRAMQIYDQVRHADPTNIHLQMAMLDYYKTNRQDSLYAHTRDSIITAPNTDSRLRLTMMRRVIQESGVDSTTLNAITQRFEQILALDTTDTDTYALYAAFLEYRQMPETQLRDVMQRLLRVHPDNEAATRWLMQYYINLKDYAALEEICRRGVNYHPEELTYAYFLTLTLIERDNTDEALQVLQRTLSAVQDHQNRPTLVSDMYNIMGDLYYRKDQHRQAYQAYDDALSYNKDNVLCLNNYAYYLSLHNQDLDRAEEMSYRAIHLETGNKTYIDTHAWVLFMQGKYPEAQQYMDQVVSPDSSSQSLLDDPDISPVLIEHAADISWMNSDRERAIQLWDLAVSKDPTKATPLLLKKQRRQKYYKK